LIDVWGTPVVSDVEDIIDFLRIEIHSQGSHLLADMNVTAKNVMLTCVAHGNGTENHPSMGIMTEDVWRNDRLYKAGTVHCFTCDYTVDLAELISECFGYHDKGYYGYKWITANFVNLSIENRKDINLDMSRTRGSENLEIGIKESELESYRHDHPYMYKRKLTSKVIDYFDVGYDKKTDSLTFPVHDLRGVPLFIQRRSVAGKNFKNDVTTLKGSVLYGLYQVYLNLDWIKEVWITESIIDALTLWTHRIASVATMQAIPTVTQIELMRKLPVRTLMNAQDNDKSGRLGAKRWKKELGNEKLMYRALFPTKDVNELDYEEIPLIGSEIM
jgi:DNA primase